MRRESTLSQTLEKSTVVLSEKINPNQRQEYLIQTPLMTVEHVYKLKMLRRKKTAVSLEVREAVYKYLAEVIIFMVDNGGFPNTNGESGAGQLEYCTLLYLHSFQTIIVIFHQGIWALYDCGLISGF